MRSARKIVSSLLVCVGLIMATLASPALAFVTTGTGADFEGAWDTVIAEINAKFRVYLHHEGNEITGNFENQQGAPQYNGRLKGVVENGRLYYTWWQPKTGATGDGQFTIASDGILSGVVRNNGESVYRHWEGHPTKSTAAAHATAPGGGGDDNGGGGGGGADIRTVGANGTTVYEDADGTTETGEYLNPGDQVTVVDCPTWSCQISAPFAGYVDKADLKG
jgi:hypothetical protein